MGEEENREKYKDIDNKKFYEYVKTAFSMRRKTLLNNLSQMFSKDVLKNKLGEKFLSRRAESLSLDEFVQSFKALTEK